jgi:molybdate transport system substrate-binding protein
VTQGRKIIATLPIVILLFSTAAVADEVKVLCPPPLRATLAELTPLFERESGHRLLVSYEPSRAIIQHVKSGQVPDIVLLTVPNVDELRALGLVEDRVDLVRSRIGIAVRSGATEPDVSSTEAFKRTLLAAKSFARNEGADSGIYMASLLEHLGIAEQMHGKTTLVRSGYVAELVANGQAEIGATDFGTDVGRRRRCFSVAAGAAARAHVFSRRGKKPEGAGCNQGILGFYGITRRGGGDKGAWA